MKAPYHSIHTPSESDPETLEYLFVAREDLARGIMEGILDSATSGNKHQRLLIGPRGIGKTHFVALIYHRVCANPELKERLRIAWLREDLYVASYPDLLLEILRALAQEYPMADLGSRIEKILDLRDPDTQGAALERLLRDSLDDRTLLLITENLHDLLSDLKEEGQHKLRAFIQNHRSITILATATSLVAAVADRKKAFYGFFRISPLEPFGIEQAEQLLVRLAERAQDADLADAIRSPMGRARVRAVHYLAGGNPRIYALFYDFLNRESLDDMARPFMKLMDELTPYYQAKMSSLAPLQRRIIDVLRRLRGASPVREIARQAMNSPQSISRQLGKLEDLGYVIQADSLGRSNYYELREPLMRLCLEVKEQQGRTVELFVQFLRVWYSETELDRLVGVGAADLEQAHLYEAARRAMSEQDPLQASLAAEFFRLQIAGNYEQALTAAELAIARAPGLKENWIRKAQCLTALDRGSEGRLACWMRVAEIDPEDWLAWNYQDTILCEMGRHEDARCAAQRAVELKPEEPILNRNYSSVLATVGRESEARIYREKALHLGGEPMTASALDLRGHDLWALDRREEALAAFRKALELDPHLIKAWGHLWGGLAEQGRYRLFQKMASHMVRLLPEEAMLHSYYGTALVHSGRGEEALAAYENALKLDSELNRKGQPASLYRALTLNKLGRDREAFEVLEQCEPGATGSTQFRLDLAHAGIQMWLDRWAEGQSELDRLLERSPRPLWPDLKLGGFVGAPLVRSPNPAVWRRFITTWLASFGNHRRFAELGQWLVHSLRLLILPWISDRSARDWYETWKELAGHIAEMTLPLRLLGAGVEYRANRDRRALLHLAREERGLLEPWLVNMFEEEPTETDREMETLLRTVDRHLAEEAAAERARAFWESPVPDLETLDFARLLSNYGDRPPSHPSRLLPGRWQKLSRSEAERFLRHVATHDDRSARAWSRPELQILGIDRRSLSFSRWSLYQVHLGEGDRFGAIDLMASESQALVLDGLSQTIHTLVENGTILLENPESQSEFTRFFCNALRAAAGRFQLIDSPADLPLAEGTELPAEVRILPWEPTEPSADDSPTYTGTVFYSGALFQAKFRLSSPARGFVEMLEDEPLAADLASASERFDGPIRFLEPSAGA